MTAGRLRRPALAGAGLVSLLAVVALASSGRGPVGSDDGARSVSSGWIDVVFTLALVGMVVATVALALSMRLRREDDEGFDLKRMLVAGAAVVVLFAGLAFGASLLRGEGDRQMPSRSEASGPFTPQRAAEGEAQPRETRGVGISWPAVGAAAAAAVLLYAATGGRARWKRRRARLRERRAVEAVRAVLQEALDELESGDPRRAVIAAYAGLERTLALNGLPRRPAEAPLEYTERVLGELHVSPGAVAALARLFARARFSTHEIREPERDEAVRALATVRDELGEAA